MPLSRDSRRGPGFLLYAYGHGGLRDAGGGAPPHLQGSWLVAIEVSWVQRVTGAGHGVPELLMPSTQLQIGIVVNLDIKSSMGRHQFVCEMFW
ncbi:LOW QUALITY PROTEIN: hypothetical protein GQ55_9G111800 [Panicum hallii var. hallii]|uniref:Uncharacterized protein n=1 Tax=Panicum hallii var. hallii TaxID=1504633 RepID=A0A2T7C1W2_9POAL|nr:LOW QUALITY PROTEIN: hypothetical protein GQ55_9G111800 [Panicum hallii var. hallii]